MNKYVLKKRASYLLVFVEYIQCEVQKRKFVPPKLNELYFEEALDQIFVLVQKCVYRKFIDLMREKTPEALDEILKRCTVDSSTRKISPKRDRCAEKI